MSSGRVLLAARMSMIQRLLPWQRSLDCVVGVGFVRVGRMCAHSCRMQALARQCRVLGLLAVTHVCTHAARANAAPCRTPCCSSEHAPPLLTTPLFAEQLSTLLLRDVIAPFLAEVLPLGGVVQAAHVAGRVPPHRPPARRTAVPAGSDPGGTGGK